MQQFSRWIVQCLFVSVCLLNVVSCAESREAGIEETSADLDVNEPIPPGSAQVSVTFESCFGEGRSHTCSVTIVQVIQYGAATPLLSNGHIIHIRADLRSEEYSSTVLKELVNSGRRVVVLLRHDDVPSGLDPAPPSWSLVSVFDVIDSKSGATDKADNESRKQRDEYFQRLLRDPATGRIPGGIRQGELAHAKGLPDARPVVSKAGAAVSLNWSEAGPNDVGGRTRALAVDLTDPETIIAGGVSGGIWKSTDGGASWSPRIDYNEPLGVTSVAQDPRPGHTETWYYVTGEFRGSTQRAEGARLRGSGLYRSTDGGDHWTLVNGANDITRFDSRLDYVSRIVVSPSTGSLFWATNASGIVRSVDGGESYSLVLGDINDHRWSDVAVREDGMVIAVVSESRFSEVPESEPGVYISSDDGISWTSITPPTFPESHYRNVVALAPSNPNIVYILSFTGNGDGADEDVRLHWMNLSTMESEDRSGNLPEGVGVSGGLDTQFGYNMALAVKPDDENFVLLGGTNLFRSRDGFATSSNDVFEQWIGGYSPADPDRYRRTRNHHPDQHILVFDPFDSNRLWSGHDGGISVANDIASTHTPSESFWQDMNNGYNVTQFYSVAIHRDGRDRRLIGGTQDNGTPFFTFDGLSTSASFDASSGDGAYAYLGNDFTYTSSQNGRIRRLNYVSGIPVRDRTTNYVKPRDATGQFFIHPYAIDPSDEDIMYYPAGNRIWRNTSLSSISNTDSDGTMQGWSQLDPIEGVGDGMTISAITVSTRPAHILYLGLFETESVPKVFRLDASDEAVSGFEDVSVPTAVAGAYINQIVVNPDDASEILVVMSNYNITGLFHSDDAGLSYTSVEGNLTGEPELAPGPSLRSASILPFDGTTRYFLGTSTGVYSTDVLDGSATVWRKEGADVIGNTVVSMVTSRPSDGLTVAATHGRGMFVAVPVGLVAREPSDVMPRNALMSEAYPNPFRISTTISYSLTNTENVVLSLFNAQGERVSVVNKGLVSAGEHKMVLDASELSAGTYYYTLTAGNFSQTNKFVVLR